MNEFIFEKIEFEENDSDDIPLSSNKSIIYNMNTIYCINTSENPHKQQFKPVKLLQPRCKWFDRTQIHEIEYNTFHDLIELKSPDVYLRIRNVIHDHYVNTGRFVSLEKACSLVGADVSVVLRIYVFMKKWGIINFKIDRGDFTGNLKDIHYKSGDIYGHSEDLNDPKTGELKTGDFIDNDSKESNLKDKDLKDKDSKENNSKECNSKECNSKGKISLENDNINTPNNKTFETKPLANKPNSDSKKCTWTPFEDLRLLEEIDQPSCDWQRIATNLGRPMEQCILRFLKLPTQSLIAEYIPAADYVLFPLLSTITFVCTTVHPTVGAKIAQFILINYENLKMNQRHLVRMALRYSTKRALEQKELEERKLKRLGDVLIEAMNKKLAMKVDDYNELCMGLEGERQRLRDAVEEYKEEILECKKETLGEEV